VEAGYEPLDELATGQRRFTRLLDPALLKARPPA
jgi:hypothetical protein